MIDLTSAELWVLQNIQDRFLNAKLHPDERGATILEAPQGSMELLWEDREGDLYLELNARNEDGDLIPIEIELRHFDPTAQEEELFFSLLQMVQSGLGF